MMTRLTLGVTFIALVLMVSAARTQQRASDARTVPDPTYVSQVSEWRAKHEADYTRDYVPLAGLFFLSPGENTVGSAPSSSVQLPDRAPGSVGLMVLQGANVQFVPRTGAPVTMGGRPVTTPVILSPASETTPADELIIGDIALWVHMSGKRRAIRMRDPRGEPARTFMGFRWFPISDRYRIVARFIRDQKPREIQVPSLTGDEQTFLTEGVVEFTLNGERIRMRPMTTRPGRLYFIFKDATSGRETYAAARFLYSDLAVDDTTVLDFNQAYNPPCAFNPFTTCPLPPPENRLTIAIAAGELDYPHAPKLP
jgi:uncharacterized protein (DUF1684 family)